MSAPDRRVPPIGGTRPRPDTGSVTGRRAVTPADRLARHRLARARLRTATALLWAAVALEVAALAALVLALAARALF